MNDRKILEQMHEYGVCAILRKVTVEEALKLTDALLKGGVCMVEVAFNTKGAGQIISAIKKEFTDKVIVGAGTVLDTETARIAIIAGANFILSPTLNTEVIKMCQKYNILPVPGVMTPTEMLTAWEYGAKIVKIFPAVTCKANFIKQVRGPLDQIEMMAVGGINETNAGAFLEAGACCVGIGSELAGIKLVKEGGYELVTEKAKMYAGIVKELKEKRE